MVETARDLIRNGDMFQCVLSQRFSAEERSQEDLEKALNQVLEELRIPAPNEFEDLDLSPLDFKPHIAPQKFEEMVETARDLIRNGDMFQCVLSQRFSAE
ncbi:hypothetical protein GR255_27825, partial [Mycobacterium tuberculosis]|nr:hypothetical protein [Mycobacterium tuberculosis]